MSSNTSSTIRKLVVGVAEHDMISKFLKIDLAVKKVYFLIILR